MRTAITAPPAATSTAAGTVVGDLNDPEYLNWCMTHVALNITIDVLRPICETKMEEFRKQLLRNHRKSAPCRVCSANSVITKPGEEWNKWSINCPNNVCSEWLPDIANGRSRADTKINWQNSDFSQWQTDSWQLAKLFIDCKTDNPADADATSICQLLLNFGAFKSVINKRKVDAVSLYCSVVLCPFFIVTFIMDEN